MQKQLVTYKRNDGVELSATIITPPGWTPAQGPRCRRCCGPIRASSPIPTTAGQVTGSPNRYTSISGASHLLFLTQGYAIIDDPTMPIVGPGETANDTYVAAARRQRAGGGRQGRGAWASPIAIAWSSAATATAAS